MKKLFLLLFLLLFAAQAQAAAIYLDSTPGGDCSGSYSIANRNCTGSDGNSYNTIAEVYDNLSASSTAYLRSGTYTNSADTSCPPSGTSGATTKLITYQNEVVTLNSGSPGGLKLCNLGARSWVEYDGRGTSGTSKNLIFDGQNSAPGEGVWIGNSSNNIFLRGIEVKQFPTNGSGGAIVFNNSTNSITLSHCKVSTSGNSYPDNAIYILSNLNVVEYCEITNTAGAGIQFFDDTVHVNDNVARFNYIHDTSGQVSLARGASGQAQGITISRGHRNQVYGNIVTNIECAESCDSGGGSWGIGFFSQGDDNVVVNNTIAGLTGLTPAIHIYPGVTGAIVKNNLIDQTSLQIVDLGSTTPDISNNHCRSAGTSCAQTGDPLFVNAAGGNYALQVGSPAIDAGVDLGAPYNVSYGAISRPQGLTQDWDIGAHEFAVVPVPSRRRIAISY